MGSFQDLGKRADEASGKVVEESAKVKSEFFGLSKTTKYVFYTIVAIAILGLGSCMLKGCGKHDNSNSPIQTVGTEYNVPTPQPVVVQQGSGAGDVALGAIAGMAIGTMMSNGQRYDGHNAPQTVVNKTVYVVNKGVANEPTSTVNSNPVVPKVVAPVAAAIPSNVAKAKVANPGDAAAEQARKQDALKAQLKAKQAARASAPVKSSSFKSFSKGRK